MERSRHLGCDAFTFIGFRNWKKVNYGKNCAFLNPVGEDPCSPHNNAVKYCDDLLNESMHMDKVMNVQSSEQILNNRLRVKTSIDTVRDKVEQVVLENAPKAAKYTSPTIQKEILHVIANIAALTLKNKTYAILSRHCLDIQNIHGQGYDGASNMCGEWKGLQALVLNDCPYAYYVHCFARRLQLALVAASREKSLDISNAQNLVLVTKTLIQNLRVDGWDNFLENFIGFSKIFGIDILDLSARFAKGRGRKKRDHVTVEHHYHFDIFNATIDVQLQELNNRFGEQPIELLKLCSALDPKDAYKSFNVDNICHLVEKYYPLDFFEGVRTGLKIQLRPFEHDVQNHSKFQNLSSIAELCRRLVETEKSQVYPLIDSSVHSN
ncbi:uncharacterized protein LOC115985412 [Quercus lobata]|uniref:uncharacterized protein LOC115985412 n=1 Tax=Quercus lobata TaxID=97700 RepID=UPI0012474E88|nr:uncharacterized protein LOC115985412 [Quercus lobata]